MEKEYIEVNRATYNELAKEYKERNYAISDDFYINTLFRDLDFKQGKKLLEIGPGMGARLKIFCELGLDVVAIELSEEMSKLCSQKAPNANIINKNVFACGFDFQFDYVYMEAVIHNFPLKDSKELLKLIHKWIKDEGILICMTTVDKSDSEGYEEKSDYISKKKRFRHRFTKETFEKLFEDANFKIIDKKYKEETDEFRSKLWQILYLKKAND